VRLSNLEPEQAVYVEPRIHACNDRDPAGRGYRQITVSEGIGIAPVVSDQLIGDAHL
jgi:hypothetical protein